MSNENYSIMQNSIQKTTAQNPKEKSQRNASASKNNLEKSIERIEEVKLPDELSKYYTEYNLNGFDDIYKVKVRLNIVDGEVFNIYRGTESKEGCIWIGNLRDSLISHIINNDKRIKLIVYNNHTLGYIFPEFPADCQILHASILRGASKTEGSVPISNICKVRLATKQDFEDFRCHFGSFGNEEIYIYQKYKKKKHK